MNLQEALTLPQKESLVDIDRFLRNGNSGYEQMPPLDRSAITLEGLYGDERDSLKTVTIGDGSLLLRYRNKEGAVLSLSEGNDGEIWQIDQTQGGNSRKGYRLCSGLNWPECLSTAVRSTAERVDTIVRQLQMPPIVCIDGVCHTRSEHIRSIYEKVSVVLQLRYSEEEKLFIRDLKKNTWV